MSAEPLQLVLGIDPGVTALGLALVSLRTGNVIALRTVKDGGLRGAARLARHRAALEDFLSDACVMGAAVERFSFFGRGNAGEVLRVSGVLDVVLHDRGIPCYLVAPSTLKKFATGNGSAGKGLLLKAARKLFKSFGSDHEVDAFWLAHALRSALLLQGSWCEPKGAHYSPAQKELASTLKEEECHAGGQRVKRAAKARPRRALK